MKRITINDIARQLNISACTVSNVLNGKGKFSQATRELVLQTAAELGYKPNRLAEALVRRDLHVLVVTVNAWPQYVSALACGIQGQMHQLNDYHMYADYLELDLDISDHEQAQILSDKLDDQYDALVLCGCSGNFTGPAMLSLIRNYEKPIMQIGIYAPEIEAMGLVSQDCTISGKLAAEMLHTMVPNGDVAIMVRNRTVTDSTRKLEGFSSQCRQMGLNLVSVMESEDIPERASICMQQCLDAHPQLAGVYIATDNSASACEVIAQSPAAGQLRVVATGAFPEVISNLERGIIHASLYQNMQHQGRLGITLLYQHLTGQLSHLPSIFVPPSPVFNTNWSVVLSQDEFPMTDS